MTTNARDWYLCDACKVCQYKKRCTRTNIKKHDGRCWKDELEVNTDGNRS